MEATFSGSVLVTGGSGFIGRHLCRRLRELGADVHATSRQPNIGQGVSSGVGSDDWRWHQVDVADGEAVGRLMDTVQPRVVYHLASHVVGARDRELVKSTFDANLASTVHLLDAAARLGCDRFVQVGSLEEPDLDEPLAAPSSPYAAAKAAASSYGRMFHQLYETPVVLARLFMVYGPAQMALKKLVPYVILSLLRGATPQLSSGTRPVDWIFVDDVVEGLVRISQVSGLAGQRVDLGSGQLHTIQQVVQTLYGLFDRSDVPTFGGLADRPMEQVRKAQTGLTARQLGWSPSISLEDGLRRTIDWYRDELTAGRL